MTRIKCMCALKRWPCALTCSRRQICGQISGMHTSQASAPQVLEEWVAERDLEEVLHIMGDARVPSGERSCLFLGRFAHKLQKLLLQPVGPSAAPDNARLIPWAARAQVAMFQSRQDHETHLHRHAEGSAMQMSF